MRALRDGLRGHARAILATSLLHILTHLYLVDDRRQDGHDAGVSRRGVVPPSTPLGALIERAQTTCHSGRARSHRPLAGPWQQAHFVATCVHEVR